MSKFKPTEIDKEIIRNANIRGKIKNVIHFSYDKKPYAIVINKVARLYAIRLINYEDEGEYGVEILAVKRFPNLVEFYRTKEDVENKAKEIQDNNNREIYECKYKFETYEDDMENNILIIGRTGSGKSSLANVISNANEFGESSGSISKTKNFQIKDFEWKKSEYRVIDTIGLGDTNLSPKKVIIKLAEAIYSMKRGIKQVFVVVGGKFTEEEIELFELAEKIFEKKIIKYTTIVRSKFDCFEEPEKCKEDIDDLKKENKKIADLISRCNGIIYVNNPPLSGNKKRREIDQADRKKSREVLLNHLNTHCQKSYKMDHWDEICVGINDYMNAKKYKEEKESSQNLLADVLIKKEIKELKQDILEEIKSQSNNVEAPLLEETVQSTSTFSNNSNNNNQNSIKATSIVAIIISTINNGDNTGGNLPVENINHQLKNENMVINSGSNGIEFPTPSWLAKKCLIEFMKKNQKERIQMFQTL
ncbi:13401_t:CDS:2 [Entrophospora sp. SA101]|nr:13401_t:CDS:2 [Entrophospora sp. SA101]